MRLPDSLYLSFGSPELLQVSREVVQDEGAGVGPAERVEDIVHR